MSHTTRRKSAIKDLPTLQKAVKRIPGAKYMGKGESKRYGGQKASGHNVKLPGWSYPVTFDLETGECTFDNYEGRWGEESELDKLKQGYSVEAAKAKVEAEGLESEEIQLTDGSIKLTIALNSGDYGVEGGGGEWDV